MAAYAKEGKRPGRSVQLIRNLDQIQALRSRDPEAWQALREDSTKYLRRCYAGGLSPDDFSDITAAALKEMGSVLDEISDPETLDRIVIRTLERHRKREKRGRKRRNALDETYEATLPSPGDPVRQIETRDWLSRLVELLDLYMHECLDRLSDRDHDLLIVIYGFDQTGSTPRGGNLSFPSSDAEKRALSRARERFRKHLEQRIETAIEEGSQDPELLQDALRFVRGKLEAGFLEARDAQVPRD